MFDVLFEGDQRETRRVRYCRVSLVRYTVLLCWGLRACDFYDISRVLYCSLVLDVSSQHHTLNGGGRHQQLNKRHRSKLT